MKPSSTHLITECSKTSANLTNSVLLSFSPLTFSPLVQAKIEAIELVEVSPPYINYYLPFDEL